ncbi:MAG TPA: hypothetical protein VKE49_01000 [Myxococcaceae bacterium]|nr:hypothetical protein [Myxococcaceae bacterium]
MLTAGRRSLAGVLIVLALPSVRWARAETSAVQRYLTAAARLYENLEYERALEQLARAKSHPRELGDDVAIALYEGIILADMGRRDESTAAFRTALLLKPDAALPVKVSPKVEQDFEKLRSKVRSELAPIIARQEAERKKRSERAQQIKPTPESLPPAYQPDAKLARSSEGFTFKRALPYGLLGVSAIAGGVGAFFGIQSRNHVSNARTADSQDAAQSQLHQANQDATIANVLFATAMAAAGGAVVSFFLRDEAPAADSK